MTRIVVLATGTGAGKTYATCALAKGLAALPEVGSVLALKPIETGVDPRDSAASLEFPGSPTDAARLGAVSLPVFRPASHCYAFEPPISPHLAARRAGIKLNLDTVAQWVAAEEGRYAEATGRTPRDGVTLIETAGGALAPLDLALCNLDLVRALAPACTVLVVPDRLGVLHDLRATLMALEQLGHKPGFLLFNAIGATDASIGTNADEAETLGFARVDARLDYKGAIPAEVARRVLVVASALQ